MLWIAFWLCTGGLAIAYRRWRRSVQMRDLDRHRLSLAEEVAGFGVWEGDLARDVWTLSEGAWKLSGISGANRPVTQQELHANTHPDDVANLPMGTVDVAGELEFRVIFPDGSIQWRRTRAYPELDSKGSPIRLIGTILDITAEKLMMQQLSEAVERLTRAERAARFGVWECDIPADIFTLSESAAMLSGLDGGGRFERSVVLDRIWREDRAVVDEATRRAYVAGGDCTVEFRVQLWDGSLAWRRSHGRVELDSSGRAVRMTGALLDTTDEKRMLQELSAAAERLRRSEQAARFGVFECDLVTNTWTLSERCALLSGVANQGSHITAADLYSKTLPQDLPAIREANRKSFETGGERLVEFRVILEDGSVGWRRSKSLVELDASGRPLRMTGALLDITAEKQMLQQLEDAAERLARAEDVAHFGIWELDVRSGVMMLSAGAAALSGFEHVAMRVPVEKVNGMVHPEDQESMLLSNALENIEDGRDYTTEFRVVHPNGAVLWCRSAGRVQVVDQVPVRVTGLIVDITKEKTLLFELQRNAERRKLAEAAAGFGVFEIDYTRGLVTGSDAWLKLEGLEDCKEGLSLQRLHQCILPEDLPAMEVALQEAAESGVCRAEYRTVMKDGSAQWRRVAALVEFEGGHPVSMIGAAIDIDHGRKLRDAAETASRAKSAFLATMSHEIRTPMNGILGMAQWLMETSLTEEHRDALETILSCGESLMQIINEILDFSKIEAGKLELENIEFELPSVFRQALRTVAVPARQKGLELACDIAGDVPRLVIGDPVRLRQVITNLLGNAVKFTSAGEIAVACGLIEHGESRQMLQISVADTGIGIPADKLDSIFRPFEQADMSTTRQHGGTGLGLAISSRLAEAMGGRIWVESKPGKGSKFAFTIGLGVSDRPALPDWLSLTGKRALIVDDNSTNRLILERTLASWDMVVTAAQSAEAALKVLQAAVHPFEIVITDAEMPGMDGFDLVRDIRQREEYQGAQILVLSSGGVEDAGRARAVGAQACLVKPADRWELLKALLEIWPADRIPPPQFAPPVPPWLDNRVLLVEDNLVNQKVVSQLLKKVGLQVTTANNGAEALSLLTQHSFDLCFMDVHMPIMDGRAATEEIRKREAGSKHLPIIALTADAFREDRERCLEAGMDDYLAKPIEVQRLQAVLDRWLHPDSDFRGRGSPFKANDSAVRFS